MSYEPELEVALESAARSARRILELYGPFVAIPDARADITTEADRDSQELILQTLHRRFPADAFCAEEQTPTLAACHRTGDRLWVIDPIDGTRGFAQKNGEFSVMIGLIDRGAIALGVVLEPARQRLTYAVRGGGCWQRDGEEGPLAACRVSKTAELARATLVQSHSRPPGVASRQAVALRRRGWRRRTRPASSWRGWPRRGRPVRQPLSELPRLGHLRRPHPRGRGGGKGDRAEGPGDPLRRSDRGPARGPAGEQRPLARSEPGAAARHLLTGPPRRPLTPLRCVRGSGGGRLLRSAACAARTETAYSTPLRARLGRSLLSLADSVPLAS